MDTFSLAKRMRAAQHPTHWERLTKLVPGDVVVHYAEGAIRCCEPRASRRGRRDAEEDASVHGWRVDVEMWTLPTPVAGSTGSSPTTPQHSPSLARRVRGRSTRTTASNRATFGSSPEDGLAVVREGSPRRMRGRHGRRTFRSRSWMFPRTQRFFDVRRAVKTLHEMTWTVRQHKSEIRVNDTVFLWEAGPKSAIVALAQAFYRNLHPHRPTRREEPFFVEKVTIDESEPVVRLARDRTRSRHAD